MISDQNSAIRNSDGYGIPWSTFFLFSFRGLQRLSPVTLGCFVGLSYVVGFIVSNVAFADYRIVSFELFKGQYIAASILFLLFTPLPFIFGMHFASEIKQSRIRLGWRTLIRFAVIFVLAAFVCGTTEYLIRMISLRVYYASWSYGLYFFLSFVMGAIPIAAGNTEHGVTQATLLLQPILALATPVILITFFGYQIYPSISPTYGGGSIWTANIVLSEELALDLPSPLQNVVILDQSSSALTILMCGRSGSGMPDHQPIVIGRDDVRLIRLLDPVSLPHWITRQADSNCG